MTNQYTMWIEKPANTVKMHGFHLGTDFKVAESIVLEKLRNDPAVVSVALRRNASLFQPGELIGIYDWRSLDD